MLTSPYVLYQILRGKFGKLNLLLLLPNFSQIVDRSTIARHLLSDQNDPFTRAPLTMEQVEPLDDLKAAIQAWMDEKRRQKS